MQPQASNSDLSIFSLNVLEPPLLLDNCLVFFVIFVAKKHYEKESDIFRFGICIGRFENYKHTFRFVKGATQKKPPTTIYERYFLGPGKEESCVERLFLLALIIFILLQGFNLLFQITYFFLVFADLFFLKGCINSISYHVRKIRFFERYFSPCRSPCTMH